MSTQSMSDIGITGERSNRRHSEPEGSTTIDTDDVFHLLQNSRRRSVIRYILAHPEQDSFEMRRIAEQIAAWENDKPVAQISSVERQRVYIALYQSHLPKLDEHGVVKYDQSRGVVMPTALLEYVGRFLSVEAEESDATVFGVDTALAGFLRPSTFKCYIGASLLGVLLITGSWLGMLPTVLASSLTTFVTGLFTIITIGAQYFERLST